MKLTPRKRLIKELDKLWTEIVKLRAGNKCQYCGRNNIRLNAHHIHSRSRYATRWDLDNGVCLCFTHHRLMHDDPEEAMKFYKTLFTQEQWEQLKTKAHQLAKFSLADLEQMRDKLKEELKKFLTRNEEDDKMEKNKRR